MNCQTVRNLISAYIDCELAPEQKRELRNHLFICQECQAEYQQLLAVKKCLENFEREPENFNPLEALYDRLEHERIAFLPQNCNLYWSSRILMMVACLFAFFLSTFMLFPLKANLNSNFNKLAQEQSLFNLEESVDQNISIDHPVTVYQASLALP